MCIMYRRIERGGYKKNNSVVHICIFSVFMFCAQQAVCSMVCLASEFLFCSCNM